MPLSVEHVSKLMGGPGFHPQHWTKQKPKMSAYTKQARNKADANTWLTASALSFCLLSADSMLAFHIIYNPAFNKFFH
jgi:hypothetical protein